MTRKRLSEELDRFGRRPGGWFIEDEAQTSFASSV
jgi:hypothetical protein